MPNRSQACAVDSLAFRGLTPTTTCGFGMLLSDCGMSGENHYRVLCPAAAKYLATLRCTCSSINASGPSGISPNSRPMKACDITVSGTDMVVSVSISLSRDADT